MARTRIANKFYVDSEGKRTNVAQEDSVGFGFDFYDPSGAVDEDEKPVVVGTITHNLSSFSDEIVQRAALMGMLQKIGDAYAGKPDEAQEIAETMVERLQNGEWVVARSGGVGPRPSMLLSAMERWAAGEGHEVTDELKDKFRALLKTEEGRKQAMATPAIRANYETLRAEAAAERAKKAAEAAASAEETEGGLDLSAL